MQHHIVNKFFRQQYQLQVQANEEAQAMVQDLESEYRDESLQEQGHIRESLRPLLVPIVPIMNITITRYIIISLFFICQLVSCQRAE